MDIPEKLDNKFIDFDENGLAIIVPAIPQPCKQRAYKINEGDYECNICHKKFMKKAYWKRHELSHDTCNLFECNVCNKKFVHKIHLNQHMILHQEKQYKCDVCGIKIHYKFNFEKHRKIHVMYTTKNGEIKYL